MISYTVIAGDLGDCFFLGNGEPFRYVKINFVGSLTGERPHEITYQIPVHAFGGAKSSFYTLNKGSKVILRGWLEARDEIGVVVVSELEELFPKMPSKHSSRAKTSQN